MFDMVNAPYQPKYVITPDWFSKYWWTSTEENEFRQWLKEQLISLKGLRQVFLNHPTIYDKTMINRAISDFLLNYGWVTLYKNKFDIREEGEPEGYYDDEIKKVLSKKDYKDYSEFMAGQTMAKWKGHLICYTHDFNAWMEHRGYDFDDKQLLRKRNTRRRK